MQAIGVEVPIQRGGALPLPFAVPTRLPPSANPGPLVSCIPHTACSLKAPCAPFAGSPSRLRVHVMRSQLASGATARNDRGRLSQGVVPTKVPDWLAAKHGATEASDRTATARASRYRMTNLLAGGCSGGSHR